MQTLQLKICDTRLICKIANNCLNVCEWVEVVEWNKANKCLNVSERVEVVEWNKRRSPPSPCRPVSRQCP